MQQPIFSFSVTSRLLCQETIEMVKNSTAKNDSNAFSDISVSLKQDYVKLLDGEAKMG